MIQTFHFLRPWWLLLIIPLLCIWVMLWRVKNKSTTWSDMCDPHLLPHLLQDATGIKKRWWLWPLLIAWILATLAMAGPTFRMQPTPTYHQVMSRVILLDVSPNMLAGDLKPDRLTRAKFKIIDLLKNLNEGQVALTVFAGEAHVVSPLTQDAQTIISLIPAISTQIMPVQGDDMAAGIKLSQQLLQNAKQKHGEVILVTSSRPNADAITAAKNLTKVGYALNVWGIGTKTGAPIPTQSGFMQNTQGQLLMAALPVSQLHELANIGNGKYIAFSNTNTDITDALTIKPQGSNAIKDKSRMSQRWLDDGYWLLLPLLLLGLLAFRRGYWQ